MPTPSVTTFLPSVIKAMTEAVMPSRCSGCRLWNDGLFCTHCKRELKPICAPYCARCGIAFDPQAQVTASSVCADCRSNRYHKDPQFTLLRSVYHFEGPIREAVHHFKYHDKTALAAPLAELLATYLQTPTSGARQPAPIPLSRLQYLVPIPLHPWRRWRRGYNQSALLARELGKQVRLPVVDLLTRTRHTAPQIDLPADDRARNVKDAFAVQARVLQAMACDPVLLIDDVCTTGATIDECAGVLRRAGFHEIYGLTIARRD